MSKLLIIFEDNRREAFSPANLLRPVYLLRSGMLELWRAIKRPFPGYDLRFESSSELAFVVGRETGSAVNTSDWQNYQRVILFNGAALATPEFVKRLETCPLNTAFFSGDILGAVVLEGGGPSAREYLQIGNDPSRRSEFAGALENCDKDGFTHYGHLWDLMVQSPSNIGRDFKFHANQKDGGASLSLPDDCSLIGDKSDLYLHPESEVDPGVVFNTTEGPISLDEGVKVESGSLVIGPFSAGPQCRLLGGKLAGSSLGPVCQIAGELDESVLQGHVNKHHAGFIGHSYVGEWVNFGAMTTNSDLKNNYSSVRVSQGGQLLDTGLTKVGSFIGDHTKFGIGTLLNTGISIGAVCNIFGGTLITEKEIPSLSWGGGGGGEQGDWQDYDLDRALVSVAQAMARRDRVLSDEDISAIRSLKHR